MHVRTVATLEARSALASEHTLYPSARLCGFRFVPDIANIEIGRLHITDLAQQPINSRKLARCEPRCLSIPICGFDA